MKNTTTILIIIAVLAVVGGGVYFFSRSSDTSQKTAMITGDDSMMKDDSHSMMKDEAMMNENSGRYVEYTNAAFEAAASGKRVLFFYADWCPTCRPADADFTKNESKIPEGVAVIRVNYNDTSTDQDEKDLAKQYGVTYQHTYVQIDENEAVVTKWNGGQTDELLANIK
jgi:thiol-disulfide isomerase/thioredoxin